MVNNLVFSGWLVRNWLKTKAPKIKFAKLKNASDILSRLLFVKQNLIIYIVEVFGGGVKFLNKAIVD